MGCTSSTVARNGDDINNTPLSNYESKSKRRGVFRRRRLFSHVSNGSSSGVSSACTTPNRHIVVSRCNSVAQSPRLSTETQDFHVIQNKIPLDIDMVTVCDDFQDAGRRLHNKENNSFGYYSESLSSIASTPSHPRPQKNQVYNQQPSRKANAVTPIHADLDMEIYMISQTSCIMPNTSSPILQRKDVTFDSVSETSSSSLSYEQWTGNLKSDPVCMANNVTAIPEAITGNFSPFADPAFINLDEMESAAERFKVDINSTNDTKGDTEFYQKLVHNSSAVTFIMSTEL